MLKISKTKLFFCHLLEYGGLVAGILTAFATYITNRSLWGVLCIGCFVLWIVGQFWRDGLYRCPHCDTKLLPRKGRGLPGNTPTKFCSHCGWKVQIEIE